MGGRWTDLIQFGDTYLCKDLAGATRASKSPFSGPFIRTKARPLKRHSLPQAKQPQPQQQQPASCYNFTLSVDVSNQWAALCRLMNISSEMMVG